MQSLPFDDMHAISQQLALLNLLLFVLLVCKAGAFVSSVIARRDPPRKLIRPKLAQSDES